MRRVLVPLAVAVVLLYPRVGYTWGDKFLVSGRGPDLASMHRPPRPLDILIYGDVSSPAIAAVSGSDFSSTLEMVGHKVTKCNSSSECTSLMAKERFDVVLADPQDAARLKQSNQTSVVALLFKPSKQLFGQTKHDYSFAFDASKDPLRLLPLLVKASKGKP